jgi:hypothetical protein
VEVPNSIKEALLKVDEVQLIELLDLKVDEILERLEDRIVARLRYLKKELEFLPEEKYEELNFE